MDMVGSALLVDGDVERYYSITIALAFVITYPHLGVRVDIFIVVDEGSGYLAVAQGIATNGKYKIGGEDKCGVYGKIKVVWCVEGEMHAIAHQLGRYVVEESHFFP